MSTRTVEAELQDVIDRVTPMWLDVHDDEASERPRADAWSPKEIVGHLIDSAANNHRRFVEAQFVDHLMFPGYVQDAWVSAQRYQDRSWRSLVRLWHDYNAHLCHVIAAIPPAVRTRQRTRHSLHLIAWRAVPEREPVTLEYFMRDYVGHLEHHVSQVAAMLGLGGV